MGPSPIRALRASPSLSSLRQSSIPYGGMGMLLIDGDVVHAAADLRTANARVYRVCWMRA
ncbi:Protein of unknown function [Pyronema omphalodes CBS 100304]|uniref:Uncharacterized protein n=1 Tax=Pyronema omphalodes (strain CBS 100304) TaxID=1076935 RepID=U4LKH8_PYROM|nr:Protein of unknown function [Pyronema omphalodes CBS 100304]